jgi:hypothetical protein
VPSQAKSVPASIRLFALIIPTVPSKLTVVAALLLSNYNTPPELLEAINLTVVVAWLLFNNKWLPLVLLVDNFAKP